MKEEQLQTIRTYCGDCMEVMGNFPTGFFDLAIVDPPYGINVTRMSMGSGGGVMKATSRAKKLRKETDDNWDAAPPGPAYFLELFRVSRNQVIWGGNCFGLPPTRCMVVWDKEQVLETFSQAELAWTSFDCPIKLFRHSCAGFRDKSRRKVEKIHPTEKPVDLYGYLLNQFAFPGAKILDTHGGSMSHAIACHEMNMELVIVERNEVYYNKAVKRLKWHQRQQKLW